ncbi:glycoside hydrolase [Bimuria novae-zelandiae CBS 107.79]|uniref:chitinase n=1 Tax=Bimuria novae-zelandiae CBS 107.79 TaxID=1447943 RepID=A0A6A5V1B1_9PLEO|nr:glycoside hydrolase [Bimuria novae-zelandiae CBS 107.79]
MGLLATVSVALAAAATIHAGYSAASKSKVVLYWGQNSAGQQSTQTRLSDYCADPNVDVLLLSFLLRFSGTGGQPVMNFANQGDRCTLFPGMETFRCPEIEADIKTCQAQGKTIMLSIGGDSYTEGGFISAAAATAGAEKTWAMFGPVQAGNSTLRPFGTAVLDGLDFDFEANVSNMATFGNRLHTLMNAAGGKQYYLSAAPQCPYPDWYNQDILNNVPMDWVNVQFYNNGCGASSYVPGATDQWNFNFNQWDAWAKASKNPSAKVLLGIPANTGAGRGYLSPSALQPVFQYSAKYSSFGGVMMWDASQAGTNPGFVASVKNLLRGLRKREMKWGDRKEDVLLAQLVTLLWTGRDSGLRACVRTTVWWTTAITARQRAVSARSVYVIIATKRPDRAKAPAVPPAFGCASPHQSSTDVFQPQTSERIRH